MKETEKHLSGEESLDIFRELKKTRDEAKMFELKNQLIVGNMPLVKFVCRKYMQMHSDIADDILQMGVLGLKKAIDKFELDKGFQFSTYAYYWIRQGARRYVDNEKGKNYKKTMSISTPIPGMEDEKTLEDALPDPVSEERTFSEIERKMIHENIQRVLKNALTKKEKKVICYRFGIELED